MLSTDYYSSGIDKLKHLPIEIRAKESGGKAVIYVREQAITNNGKTSYTLRDRYISGQTLSGFENKYEYHFYEDGSVVIKHTVDPQGTMPKFLPRIGISMMLDSGLQNVEWYGRGPQENYPDRKSGYKIGIYKNSIEKMYEPYLIPQDHGLRTDNKWVRFTDENNNGLEFSMNEAFNFNAYPYETENLTRAHYTYQLNKAEGTTVNLDYKTTGLGGTARPVFEPYRAYPTGYSREITIRMLK